MRLSRRPSKNRAGLKKESRKKERKDLPLQNREKTLVRESDILPELFEKERKKKRKKGCCGGQNGVGSFGRHMPAGEKRRFGKGLEKKKVYP